MDRVQRFGQGNRKTEHAFAQVPVGVKPRSAFDRSCSNKGTFNEDNLVPFFLDEVLPGDTFNLNTTILARMATQLVPVMDNLYLDTFWFFVPNRLLWDNWQKFMGEQLNPGDSIDYTIPKIRCTDANGFNTETLADYFGLPIRVAANVRNIDVCALPFRAYNLIWREWFRDENLQNSPTVDKGNGPDTYTNYTLLKRGKRHDYFTSCLPWPQKGVGVNLPLGSTAPIILTSPNTGAPGKIRIASTGNVTAVDHSLGGYASGAGTAGHLWGVNTTTELFYDPNGTLVADLTNATAATINSLRQAYNIQKLLEKDARGGSRYIESIKVHFGVTSPDARLQRPEFLGGSSAPIIVAPVAKSADSFDTSDNRVSSTGQLRAYAVAQNRSGFVKSFVEHGFILGLMAVRADITYQQGMHKMWTRNTRYDFYYPVLANLGEQAVLNKEIYYQNDAGGTIDNGVFGYQERFGEYRYKPSQIVGYLRSTAPAPLDVWHLAEKFTSLPTLGSTFVQSSTPISRVVAVTSEAHFVFDSWTQMKCVRVMPTFSVPGWDNKF